MNGSQNSNIPDELLSAYIDNAVTDAERRLIESVVATDSNVAWRLESLVQTVQLLNEVPQLVAPRAFRLSAADLATDLSTGSESSRIAVGQPATQRRQSKPIVTEATGGFWRWLWRGGNPMLRNAAAAFALLFFVLLVGDVGRDNLRNLANSSVSPTEIFETSAQVLTEALPTLTKGALAAPQSVPLQETVVVTGIESDSGTAVDAVAIVPTSAAATSTGVAQKAALIPQTADENNENQAAENQAAQNSSAAAGSQARAANALPPTNTPSPLATPEPAALAVPLLQADDASADDASASTASTFALEQPASDAEAADGAMESRAFAEVQAAGEPAQDDLVASAAVGASVAITPNLELPTIAAAQAQSETTVTDSASAAMVQESRVQDTVQEDAVEEGATAEEASEDASEDEPVQAVAIAVEPANEEAETLASESASETASEEDASTELSVASMDEETAEAEEGSATDSSNSEQDREVAEESIPLEEIDFANQNGFPLLLLLQIVSGIGALLLGTFWWRSRASHNSPKRVQ